MSRPKAYDPQEGYKYQILCKNRNDREWEHTDYAEDRTERDRLIAEYRAAYGPDFHFTVVTLPQKYWPKAVKV